MQIQPGNKKKTTSSNVIPKYHKSHSSMNRIKSNKTIQESAMQGGISGEGTVKSWLQHKKKMQKIEEKFN